MRKINEKRRLLKWVFPLLGSFRTYRYEDEDGKVTVYEDTYENKKDDSLPEKTYSLKYIKIYNQQGDIISTEVTNLLNPSHISHFRFEHEYDASGNKIKTIMYNDSIHSSEIIHHYDSFGNEIGSCYGNSIFNSEYDEESMILTVTIDNGKLGYSTTKYHYDNNGNIIYRKTDYTHDPKLNKIETEEEWMEYDEYGNKISERYAENTLNTQSYRKYTYDFEKNTITITSVTESGDIIDIEDVETYDRL